MLDAADMPKPTERQQATLEGLPTDITARLAVRELMRPQLVAMDSCSRRAASVTAGPVVVFESLNQPSA
jgi:hypothetical protein